MCVCVYVYVHVYVYVYVYVYVHVHVSQPILRINTYIPYTTENFIFTIQSIFIWIICIGSLLQVHMDFLT